jgi:hypothetical protein
MPRKWGLITSGATFQALVSTIIFFEDSKAILFGRPGKDGGQDARSGDGTRVFQMKHHADGSAASAIRDAKEEAANVAKYRTPGHERHDQWLGVKHWRLVTNALFNPTDRKRWDDEVVPLFKGQGFDEVDIWSQEYLDALLDKQPEIHRAFFDGKTRAFLSVAEAKERMLEREPFLRRDELGEFVGRTTERDAVSQFLKSKALFLIIHGTGGMGKTRLLLEAGEEIAALGEWQVLWANVETMLAADSWFEGVVPERPTLLLVDEPDDESLLKVLAEQLGGRNGRISKWKVAVAARSPKDPVLRFLFGPRMKQSVTELPVDKLPDADAMCAKLLATGKLKALPEAQRIQAARDLSKRFSQHPVWLTLAVQHLEDRGDLSQVPASAKQLADDYLREVEAHQSEVAPEVIRELLRWVALVGKVNREDQGTLEQIGKASSAGGATDVLSRLASLVKRRVLTQRGANNRLVELKPDVLRDHVLLDWLSKDVGVGTTPVVASDSAKALTDAVRDPLVRGSLDRLGRSVLVSLARTEFLLDLGGHKVDILGQFFASLKATVPSMTASQRVALAEVLELVAVPQPLQVVSVIREMRTSPAQDERLKGMFEDRVVTHADVVLSLAWPLAHAAMGARTDDVKESVLRELCAVVGAELRVASALKYGLPNDGKRGTSLVTRVLEGGPQYWGDFDAVAKKLGLELLDALSSRPPTADDLALLKALVQPAMAVERRQTWADERAFHFRTFFIGPGHPAWTTREELLTKVKQLLAADATPSESRLVLWPVFAEAHRNINYGNAHGDEAFKANYSSALLEDLEWTHNALSHRKAGAEELGEARAVWDWHRRFEKDPTLIKATANLEALYAADDLAKEFEPLLSHDDWKQKGPRAKAKAVDLSAVSSPDEIAAFVERGARFIGSDDKLGSLLDVAAQLGLLAEDHDVIQRFVTNALSAVVAPSQLEFAITVAGQWVFSVREGTAPEHTAPLVQRLQNACRSDTVRVSLLLEIYGRVPRPDGVKDFTAEEHALLRAQRNLFTNQGRTNQYIAALATTLKHDWPVAGAALEDLVRAVALDERPASLYTLVYAVYWVVKESESAELPPGLGEWVLDQLLLLPDFASIGGNDEWHLREILQRVKRPSVAWLPSVLTKRRELEAAREDDAHPRQLSHHPRISEYVQPISAADVQTPEVVEAVNDLLAFVGDNGAAGYYLPEVLHNVDPGGVLVPKLVVELVSSTTDIEQVRRLARIGGAHVVGTEAWKVIAKAVLRAARSGEESQRSVFRALGASDVTTWSGVPGQVPEVFRSAVVRAKEALAAESDELLQAYWSWRVRLAEAELEQETQHAKEERGE